MRLILTAILLVLAYSTSVFAQQRPCGPTVAMMQYLTSNYQEIQTHLGVTADGSLIAVTVSPSGSWSLLVHTPTGITCLLAHGEGWQNSGPSNPFPGAPGSKL